MKRKTRRKLVLYSIGMVVERIVKVKAYKDLFYPLGVLIFIEFPAEVCNFPEVLDKSSIFFKDTAQRDIFERGCLLFLCTKKR